MVWLNYFGFDSKTFIKEFQVFKKFTGSVMGMVVSFEEFWTF